VALHGRATAGCLRRLHLGDRSLCSEVLVTNGQSTIVLHESVLRLVLCIGTETSYASNAHQDGLRSLYDLGTYSDRGLDGLTNGEDTMNDFKQGLLLGILLMGIGWCVTVQLYHNRLVEVKERARQDTEDQIKSCDAVLTNLVENCTPANRAIPEQSEDLRRF